MTFHGLPGFTGDSLPLAPGSLFGFRAFDVIPETGELKGVSFPETWNEGENVATCALNKKEHSMTECSHGYWSYFGVTNTYLDVERVKAIIEGYGEVVIGEDGFRSQKAKVKAVVLPNLEEVEEAGENLPRLKDVLRRARMLLILRVVSATFYLLGAFNMVRISSKHTSEVGQSTGDLVAFILAVVAIIAFLIAAYRQKDYIKTCFKEWSHCHKAHKESRKNPENLTQAMLTARVQNRYPDVKIYDDLGDMLSDYQGKIILHGSLLGASPDTSDSNSDNASGRPLRTLDAQR